MLVLALDTSTPAVTAGVVRVIRPYEAIAEAQSPDAAADNRPMAAADNPPMAPAVTPPPVTVLAERSVVDAFGHAEHLMPLVTGALADAGRPMSEIDAVVVGIGPGPFTGLRVGMVTAAALGDALDVPVHGIGSHDAMARTVTAGGTFVVATDARRREMYLSAYGPDGRRGFGPAVSAPAGVPDLLVEHGMSPTGVTGAGASLVAETLGLRVVASDSPLTGALVECALRPLLTGAVPGPLVPLYLRRPDAAPPSTPKATLPPTVPPLREPAGRTAPPTRPAPRQ